VIGGSQGYALDDKRARPSREAIALVLERTLELLPTLRHAHIIRTWSGTEGYLPDREPVIGLSQTTPGLVHGFGFAGAGFQIGPAVGEVLAELARDGRSSTPISAFSVARFATP
jgi:sarcosine oxidase subunit beta